MPDAAPVAVIIPAHRCAAVLDQALASVAGQTRQPVEVVVGDDASGDDTPAVARRWADRLPIEVVVLPENRGPAGARAAAIERTSAPTLALLDADDIWLPDHLETLLGQHQAVGGIVTADPLRWIPGRGLAPAGMGRDLPVPPPAEQRAAILDHDFVFIGSVFDRAAYDQVGGFRDEFRGPEDWDLWIRLIRAGHVVHRADHPTVLYRLTPTSVSADSRLAHEERKVVVRALEETTDAGDRSVLVRTRGRVEAKIALYDAYDLARQDRPMAARRRALGGLRGPGRVPLRCAALLVAPRWATKARDARVHEPRWWLRV